MALSLASGLSCVGNGDRSADWLYGLDLLCPHDYADQLNPDKENILMALKEVLRKVTAVGRDRP